VMVQTDGSDHSNERPDDCECIEIGDLPCWPCCTDGFEEPNPHIVS
jgi:hypothetical protein